MVTRRVSGRLLLSGLLAMPAVSCLELRAPPPTCEAGGQCEADARCVTGECTGSNGGAIGQDAARDATVSSTPDAAEPLMPDAAAPPTPDAAGPPMPDAAAPPTPDAAAPPMPDAAEPPTQDARVPPRPDAAEPPAPDAAESPTQDAGAPPTPDAAAPLEPDAAVPGPCEPGGPPDVVVCVGEICAPLGAPCDTGRPGVCAAGTLGCVEGAPACMAGVRPFFQQEACDGLDNNCDGEVDGGGLDGRGGDAAAIDLFAAREVVRPGLSGFDPVTGETLLATSRQVAGECRAEPHRLRVLDANLREVAAPLLEPLVALGAISNTRPISDPGLGTMETRDPQYTPAPECTPDTMARIRWVWDRRELLTEPIQDADFSQLVPTATVFTTGGLRAVGHDFDNQPYTEVVWSLARDGGRLSGVRERRGLDTRSFTVTAAPEGLVAVGVTPNGGLPEDRRFFIATLRPDGRFTDVVNLQTAQAPGTEGGVLDVRWTGAAFAVHYAVEPEDALAQGGGSYDSWFGFFGRDGTAIMQVQTVRMTAEAWLKGAHGPHAITVNGGEYSVAATALGEGSDPAIFNFGLFVRDAWGRPLPGNDGFRLIEAVPRDQREASLLLAGPQEYRAAYFDADVESAHTFRRLTELPCTYPCQPTLSRVEWPDGVDNNCDGHVDEGPNGQALFPPGGYTANARRPDEPELLNGQNEREVSIDHALAVQQTEVTQADFESLLGPRPTPDPPPADCPDCPVVGATWFEAVAYANALSVEDGLMPCFTDGLGAIYDRNAAASLTVPRIDSLTTCDGWRLPTEAEWEYMARAGARGSVPATREHARRFQPTPVSDVANARGGGNLVMAPVATLAPNLEGVHDVLGNAAEWVYDAWVAANLLPADQTDPVTEPTGLPRTGVARGGHVGDDPASLSVASRRQLDPGEAYPFVGFRLVRTLVVPH